MWVTELKMEVCKISNSFKKRERQISQKKSEKRKFSVHIITVLHQTRVDVFTKFRFLKLLRNFRLSSRWTKVELAFVILTSEVWKS